VAVSAGMAISDFDRVPLVTGQIVLAIVGFVSTATVGRRLNLRAVGNRVFGALLFLASSILERGGFRILASPSCLISKAQWTSAHVVFLYSIRIVSSPLKVLEIARLCIEALCAFGSQAISVAQLAEKFARWLSHAALRTLFALGYDDLLRPSTAHACLTGTARAPIIKTNVAVELGQRLFDAASSTLLHTASVTRTAYRCLLLICQRYLALDVGD